MCALMLFHKLLPAGWLVLAVARFARILKPDKQCVSKA